MRKLIFACVVLAVLVACGGNDADKKTGTATTGNSDISTHPDYEKGLALVAKHKCMVCHAVDDMVTGPAYKEVAKRYADRPDTIITHLANKIIKGGSGEWGEVFMTPNSNVTQEEAEAMVKYILLLK